jgi:hypothetical protein
MISDGQIFLSVIPPATKPVVTQPSPATQPKTTPGIPWRLFCMRLSLHNLQYQ